MASPPLSTTLKAYYKIILISEIFKPQTLLANLYCWLFNVVLLCLLEYYLSWDVICDLNTNKRDRNIFYSIRHRQHIHTSAVQPFWRHYPLGLPHTGWLLVCTIKFKANLFIKDLPNVDFSLSSYLPTRGLGYRLTYYIVKSHNFRFL